MSTLERLTEREEDFFKRQQRCRDAFIAFEAELNRTNATVVLSDITMEEFEAIAGVDEKMADRWYERFLSLSGRERIVIQRIILLLAHAMRRRRPDRAVELLRLVWRERALIRVSCGRARVPLDAMVAWAAAESTEGCRWCYERLDRAGNDHEIAMEVLAALLNNRGCVVRRFVEERVNAQQPEGIARALLAVGFSNQDAENKRLLRRFADEHGFIGEACRAATHAQERDAWARHWYREVCAADVAEDFWRKAVLFVKVVDGRFAVWCSEYGKSTEDMGHLWPSVEVQVNQRIERWRRKREKTLFGIVRPPNVFLRY